MGPSILNASTITVLDLLGAGRLYEVPPFQRDYSWQEEQWEDLWEDILEIHRGASPSHYLGAIVLQGISDRRFRIIDGQQRIATISLLALAVIFRLERLAKEGISPDENLERSQILRTRFIGELDPASLLLQSKLTLNETDKSIFHDYLVQGRKPDHMDRWPRSNQLLVEALDWFSVRLTELGQEANDGALLASLLTETVSRGLILIAITVEDETSAYTVFETLNARGLELSTTDLLKNYLFSRMSKGSLDDLQRRWARLVSVVGQDSFPQFLRSHMLCRQAGVRKDRLFKVIRKDIHEPSQVLDLLDQLEGRAEVFAALRDPYHSLWADHPGTRMSVRELRLFRAQEVTPLVFASLEKLSRDAFKSIIRTLSVICFRHSVIGGLNPRDLELACSRAAIAVLEGRAKTAQEVFEYLRTVYVSDDTFRRSFIEEASSTFGAQRKITRYILLTLEAEKSGRDVDFETDSATVEHILPEKPDAKWNEDVPQEAWDSYVHRLGNLTPLEGPLNRQVANKSYSDKRGAYSQSGYSLTKVIPDDAPESWTASHIVKRQEQMADLAVKIWRCDY